MPTKRQEFDKHLKALMRMYDSMSQGGVETAETLLARAQSHELFIIELRDSIIQIGGIEYDPILEKITNYIGKYKIRRSET